ncbi:MAG: DUF1576 domain-containing protein [Clostridiaceae bacterium]
MKTLNYKYKTLFLYAIFLIISSFFFNDPVTIFNGLIKIILEPDFLITDYVEVGGIGAAFFNAGILMVICILFLYFLKTELNGLSLASIWTVTGFGLFGKNIFNIWFIILGVYLYSRFQKEHFKKYIYIALFGTTLSPLVTQIMFGLGNITVLTIAFGTFMGIFIGFFLPPISSYLLRVHQGFSLYNIGFASGIIGTIVISTLRSYGFQSDARIIWSSGNNFVFSILLFCIFSSMILIGLILDPWCLKKLKKLYKYKGRLITDFVSLEGYPITLVNMGINGIFSTIFVLLIRSSLNGPTIGAIFTIVGFSGFGKHIKNITPIMFGVMLAATLSSFVGGPNINSPAVVLSALFSTTLAPIAGEFGILVGVIAGAIHYSVSLNVGYLHGGFNLYNNGFAGGIVASIIIPVVESFKRSES